MEGKKRYCARALERLGYRLYRIVRSHPRRIICSLYSTQTPPKRVPVLWDGPAPAPSLRAISLEDELQRRAGLFP